MSNWITGELDIPPKESFSERTICNWLHSLYFNVNVEKKGIYLDGHEWPDVIEARKSFAMKYASLRKQCVMFDDSKNPMEKIPNPNARFVLTSLDEKAHHANDRIKR